VQDCPRTTYESAPKSHHLVRMSMYIRLNENENQRTDFEDLDQYMERTMNVSVAVMSVKGEKTIRNPQETPRRAS